MTDDRTTDRDEGDGNGASDGHGTGSDGAVAAFLADAEDVYDEYEKGYVDADAALSVLAGRIDDLRAAVRAADDPDEGADDDGTDGGEAADG